MKKKLRSLGIKTKAELVRIGLTFTSYYIANRMMHIVSHENCLRNIYGTKCAVLNNLNLL
jgi:hypothetical protein